MLLTKSEMGEPREKETRMEKEIKRWREKGETSGGWGK